MSKNMKRNTVINRKYVYWIVQVMYGVAIIGFAHNYVHNKELVKEVITLTNATPKPTFIQNIYGNYGEGEMDQPMAVTVINKRIYVSDTANKRIQIFDYNGQSIKAFGSGNIKSGKFQYPYDLASDDRGLLYVSDIGGGTVYKFNIEGKYLGNFGEMQPSKKTFTAPAGLAFKKDKLYITDIREHTLSLFDLQGRLIKKIGSFGREPGKFFAPNSVTVDNKGTIYVVDAGNQRVQVFDPNGRFLRVLNGFMDGSYSMFATPRGVTVDDDDNVYIISDLDESLKFNETKDQDFLNWNCDSENFQLPKGLFIDNRQRLYITDNTNQGIAVYQL